MNNIYTPLHIHDDISLLDSVAKPSKIIKKCKQNNFPACAVTNHGSVGSAVKFSKLCHDNNIKPILGIEFYVSSQSAKIKNEENRSLSHSLILAKNLAGWNQLIKLVSAANRPENFYYKPRLSLEEILEFANRNLIFFSGHLGSTIADNIFTDTNKASKSSNEEEARQYLNKECVRDVSKILDMVKNGFGKENVFLEVQLIDSKVNPCVNLLAKGIRYIAEQTNTPLIATPDTHYVDREDAEDQRVLLCNSLNTTFNKITKEHGLYSFFRADNYFLPSYQEMVEFGNSEKELKNTLLISDMCENYKITRPPILPKFNCPNGLDSATYLKQLCEEGWQEKIERSNVDKNIYKERLNYELNMLTNVGLSDYFLIVEDIIKYTKQNNILAGPGRGCVIPTTKVITNNYLSKEIQNTQIGEYVITKNGKFNKILNKFEYEVEEELITINNWYGSEEGITLTPDHKILAEKSIINKQYILASKKTKNKTKQILPPQNNLQWIEAKNIEKNDWVFVPFPKREIIDITNIDLSLYEDKTKTFNKDNKYVYYFPYNKLCNTNNIIGSSKIERFLPIDKKLLFILGYFTGDGWFLKNKNNSIGFVFNQSDTALLNFIDTYFQKMGCKTTREKHKSKKIIQLYIYSRHLKNFFESLFNEYKLTSRTKHIPKLIFLLNDKLIKAYLKGYYLADGHIDKKQPNRIKYTTSSKALSSQIRILHHILKQPTSINIDDRIDTRKEFKNRGIYYNIFSYKTFSKHLCEITKDGFLLRVKSVNKQKQKTKVYDLKIENESNYLTDSFLIHNSSAGCLILYLLDVTKLDPIKYGLMISRFWNPGRSSPGKISLPDVDMDFEAGRREDIINYIRQKYGEDRVSHIITLGRLQGCGALKDVLRAYGACSFDEMNRMTKYIPNEAEISDELQAMKEEDKENGGDGEASIIRWALENQGQYLQQWAFIDNNGEIAGPYAKYFKQAIRLEGTKKTQGQHASGIVVANEPLSNLIPMVYNAKDGNQICGFSLDSCEDLGLLKIDVLSVGFLDKVHHINNLMAGKI